MSLIPRQTEKDIETSILQFLQLSGVFAWKHNNVGVFDPTRKVFRKSKNKYSINGVSDILGIFEGKFLAIEVKTAKNKVRTADQNNFIEHINNNGGVAFYASSIEDVKRELGI